MANRVFPKYKENLLDGDAPPLDTSTLKTALLRSYTYDSTDEFLADITASGATIVSTSSALTSKSMTNGIFDAADTQFSAVAAGAACSAIVVYEDSGSSATSDLVLFIDTATNLPVTPDGSDIPVAWDNGANKILAL